MSAYIEKCAFLSYLSLVEVGVRTTVAADDDHSRLIVESETSGRRKSSRTSMRVTRSMSANNNTSCSVRAIRPMSADNNTSRSKRAARSKSADSSTSSSMRAARSKSADSSTSSSMRAKRSKSADRNASSSMRAKRSMSADSNTSCSMRAKRSMSADSNTADTLLMPQPPVPPQRTSLVLTSPFKKRALSLDQEMLLTIPFKKRVVWLDQDIRLNRPKKRVTWLDQENTRSDPVYGERRIAIIRQVDTPHEVPPNPPTNPWGQCSSAPQLNLPPHTSLETTIQAIELPPQEQYNIPAMELPPQEQYNIPAMELPPQEQYNIPAMELPPQEQYNIPAMELPPQEQYVSSEANIPAMELPPQGQFDSPEASVPAMELPPQEQYDSPEASVPAMELPPQEQYDVYDVDLLLADLSLSDEFSDQLYATVTFASLDVLIDFSNRACNFKNKHTKLYVTKVKQGLEKFACLRSEDNLIAAVEVLDSRCGNPDDSTSTPPHNDEEKNSHRLAKLIHIIPHCSLVSISDMYRFAGKLTRRNHVTATEFNYDITYIGRSEFDFLIIADPVLLLCETTAIGTTRIVTQDVFANYVIGCIVKGVKYGNFFDTTQVPDLSSTNIDIECSESVYTLTHNRKCRTSSGSEPPTTDTKTYSLDLMRPLSLDVQRKRLSFMKEMSVQLN